MDNEVKEFLAAAEETGFNRLHQNGRHSKYRFIYGSGHDLYGRAVRSLQTL